MHCEAVGRGARTRLQAREAVSGSQRDVVNRCDVPDRSERRASTPALVWTWAPDDPSSLGKLGGNRKESVQTEQGEHQPHHRRHPTSVVEGAGSDVLRQLSRPRVATPTLGQFVQCPDEFDSLDMRGSGSSRAIALGPCQRHCSGTAVADRASIAPMPPSTRPTTALAGLSGPGVRSIDHTPMRTASIPITPKPRSSPPLGGGLPFCALEISPIGHSKLRIPQPSDTLARPDPRTFGLNVGGGEPSMVPMSVERGSRW